MGVERTIIDWLGWPNDGGKTSIDTKPGSISGPDFGVVDQLIRGGGSGN